MKMSQNGIFEWANWRTLSVSNPCMVDRRKKTLIIKVYTIFALINYIKTMTLRCVYDFTNYAEDGSIAYY